MRGGMGDRGALQHQRQGMKIVGGPGSLSMGDPSLAPGGPLYSTSSHGSMLPAARSPDSSPGKSTGSPQSGPMASPIPPSMSVAPGAKLDRGQQQQQPGPVMAPIGTMRFPASPMKGGEDGSGAPGGLSQSSNAQVSTNGLVREWKKEVCVCPSEHFRDVFTGLVS
jgi:hypothetical protein